jgi:hypothetical protein
MFIDTSCCTAYTSGMENSANDRGPWIKTLSMEEGGEHLKRALEAQSALYPEEYRTPVDGLENSEEKRHGAGIVMSHSLIPEALHHAFATFGVLLSEDLPLSRTQHEMIAATVSSLNRCHY